jgi:peptide/nickel transport system permease protein
MFGAAVLAVCLVGAVFAPWLAPQNPFDPAQINLLDAFTPPLWQPGGRWPFVLGTDDQGRDILSTILYGMRISLLVGLGAVALAALLGVALGLVAGFFGGLVDIAAMRLADVQLTVPALLIALFIDGLVRLWLPRDTGAIVALSVLIVAIGLADWPHYARVVRSLAQIERGKDYAAAARLAGVGAPVILWRHILPNATGPVFVLGTLGLALAIIIEATLSFLGVGMPPTQPSLGTLIRVGNEVLFSGEWWITLFPSAALVLLVLSVNLVGDWLRDALNPRLR